MQCSIWQELNDWTNIVEEARSLEREKDTERGRIVAATVDVDDEVKGELENSKQLQDEADTTIMQTLKLLGRKVSERCLWRSCHVTKGSSAGYLLHCMLVYCSLFISSPTPHDRLKNNDFPPPPSFLSFFSFFFFFSLFIFPSTFCAF